MYEMLYGQPPYRGQNHIHLVKIIERAGPLQLPSEPAVSEATQHLLLSLLQKDPSKRISFSEFFKHTYFKETESMVVSNLLATSAPRNIMGPSALTHALSRKTSLSSSPIVRSTSSSLMASSIMTSGDRFTRVSLEEELIDLVPADHRRQIRYALVLADLALERQDEPSLLLQVTALEHLLDAQELLGVFPNDHLLQLTLILQKKSQSLDSILSHSFAHPTTAEDKAEEEVDLDAIFYDYALKLALEAGIKDLLQYNAWRVYQRAMAMAKESTHGTTLIDILQERI